MGFIPSGYLALRAVIDRVIDEDNDSLASQVQAHQPEFRHLIGIEMAARKRAAAGMGSTNMLEVAKRLVVLRKEVQALEQARQTAVDKVWQALGDGALRADVLTEQGFLFPLPVEVWRAKGGRHAVITEIVSWWLVDAIPIMPINGHPIVEQAEFERWSTASSTAASEKRLQRWLAQKMRNAPDAPVSKAAMKAVAQEQGYRVSENGFDRAWLAAVQEANAPKWSAPGRKPAPQSGQKSRR